MILRTCARCGAEYEWGVHIKAFGAKAQLTPVQIRSTVHGGAADECWSAEDGLIILVADQLQDTNQVEDALWAKLWAQFAADAMGVQLEDFAPKFPIRLTCGP